MSEEAVSRSRAPPLTSSLLLKHLHCANWSHLHAAAEPASNSSPPTSWREQQRAGCAVSQAPLLEPSFLGTVSSSVPHTARRARSPPPPHTPHPLDLALGQQKRPGQRKSHGSGRVGSHRFQRPHSRLLQRDPDTGGGKLTGYAASDGKPGSEFAPSGISMKMDSSFPKLSLHLLSINASNRTTAHFYDFIISRSRGNPTASSALEMVPIQYDGPHIGCSHRKCCWALCLPGLHGHHSLQEPKEVDQILGRGERGPLFTPPPSLPLQSCPSCLVKMGGRSEDFSVLEGAQVNEGACHPFPCLFMVSSVF